MPALMEYLQDFGHLSFAERPFAPPDSLALTQMVYMPMEGLLDEGGSVTVAELWAFLAATYPDNFADPFQRKRYLMTKACAQTARFAQLRMMDYVNHIDFDLETQFCAATFALPDGSRYIAFRGTDLTLAGWKEDLNMSFMAVPAQQEAVAYTTRAAGAFAGALLLGGHSKGGHLALYAAAHCAAAVQQRIQSVYSFDGPGMDEQTLLSDGYARISAKVASYIPQSSVVGMLLCYHPVFQVVRSNTIGLWQHDALTWQVTDGAFEMLEGLDIGTQVADEALRQWIDRLTMEDRRFLKDTVFRVISALDPETIDPLVQDFTASTVKLFAAFRKLEPETRTRTRRILGDLFSSGASEAVRHILPGTFRRREAPSPLAEQVKRKQEEMAGQQDG